MYFYSLHNFSDKIYMFRFYLLFITLVLNFFITPLSFFPVLKFVFNLLITTSLLLSGANFISKDKIHLRRSWFIFGLINICIAFFSNLHPENIFLEGTKYTLLFIFFVVITVSLVQQIFSIKKVTVDVMIGSFCGYLLIGIISFFLFVLIDFSIPNSYSGLGNDLEQRISQIFYFSLTCLTTLGFGDIIPVNLVSQKLAVFTAAVGQFYIAVVVAILVSRYMQTGRNTEGK